MKIDQGEVFLLHNYILVKLTSEDGDVGWGMGFPGAGAHGAAIAADRATPGHGCRVLRALDDETVEAGAVDAGVGVRELIPAMQPMARLLADPSSRARITSHCQEVAMWRRHSCLGRDFPETSRHLLNPLPGDVARTSVCSAGTPAGVLSFCRQRRSRQGSSPALLDPLEEASRSAEMSLGAAD